MMLIVLLSKIWSYILESFFKMKFLKLFSIIWTLFTVGLFTYFYHAAAGSTQTINFVNLFLYTVTFSTIIALVVTWAIYFNWPI